VLGILSTGPRARASARWVAQLLGAPDLSGAVGVTAGAQR
jgi:hypothetical protein